MKENKYVKPTKKYAKFNVRCSDQFYISSHNNKNCSCFLNLITDVLDFVNKENKMHFTIF